MTAKASKPCVHLLVGPVGAGKTTYAMQLAAQLKGLRLSLDDFTTALVAHLMAKNTPKAVDAEMTATCLGAIWSLAQKTVRGGQDAVLELGLSQRVNREAFYAKVAAQGIDLVIYVIEAPREVCRIRVARRNVEKGRTFTREIPADFFEVASDAWQPVLAEEAHGRDVRFVSTDSTAIDCLAAHELKF